MRIIPAIDIINGNCVRLNQGDYAQITTYNESPTEVAKAFEANGVKYLHVVDLDGAKAQGIVNYKALEAIANNTNLEIDFGGGIKSENDVKTAFNAGAKQITLGSVAVSNPDKVCDWLLAYGAKRLILGADCKDYMIATHGWTKTAHMSVFDLIKSYSAMGFESIICTDIAKDGMLQGPSIELYKAILSKFDVGLTASGGVRSIDDLQELKAIGCEAAIVGKALYENKITLKQLRTLCLNEE